MTGMNVSHSNRRTKRRFLPNLQYTKLVKSNGAVVRIRVCASCLKTLSKVKTQKETAETAA